MDVSFIGQGYDRASGSSVLSSLIDALSNNRYNSFKCLVAFASHTGVSGLRQHIINSKDHIDSFRVVVGVDQLGTSREALEALLEWEVETYVFYTTQRVIFHPKVYLFSGEESSLAIVGSNNLTQKGLAQNIEGAIQISYNPNEHENGIIEQIEDYYHPLLTDESPYLQPLTEELIADLLASGIVKTEAQTRVHYKKTSPTGNPDVQGTPIGELFPSLPLQPLHPDFRPSRISVQTQEEGPDEEEAVTEEFRYVAWRKANLPRSDVLYAPEGTNPTGGLRLTQAGFRDNDGNRINQTSYFRDTVFSENEWVETGQNPYREMTTVNFQLFIDGLFKGVFGLEVRHKPSGEAGQNNYTTSISWGTASDAIRENDLRGKDLVMYYPNSEGSPFTISIE